MKSEALSKAQKTSNKLASDAQQLNTERSAMSINPAKQQHSRDNLDNDFKPVIVKMWRNLSTNYKQQMRTIFRNLRIDRERSLTKMSHVQQQFLDFLHRKDNKQEILEEFVKNFNEFSDEYPDLREDDQTKEELH